MGICRSKPTADPLPAATRKPQPVVESPIPSPKKSESRRTAGTSSRRRERERPTDPSAVKNTPGSALTSEVLRVLPRDFKFRILIVGKIGSGKSSLIEAVFKVGITAAPKTESGTTDINFGFDPKDNRYLVVHECSGLESPASGVPQNLQTILDFISRRTDVNRDSKDPERLHAIWICVPASDATSIDGLGDGVKNILHISTVPVVLVFTKFDEIVTTILHSKYGGDDQHHGRARAEAQKMYEDLCHPLPAGVVSAKPGFVDLIDNLIATTNRYITNARVPSAQSSAHWQEAIERSPVPLVWAAALRVSHESIIDATIAIGRRRYWRNLSDTRSSFVGQSIQECVNIIHFDIVEIWNLKDENGYLSSVRFKIKMSHLVNDLSHNFKDEDKRSARTADTAQSSSRVGDGNKFAKWVNETYSGSKENVCCVMGYIVYLTVILGNIFRVAASDIVSQNYVEPILDDSLRRKIRNDIRNHVKETYSLRSNVDQDIFLEKVDDLIKEHCAPPSGSGSRRDSEILGTSRNLQK